MLCCAGNCLLEKQVENKVCMEQSSLPKRINNQENPTSCKQVQEAGIGQFMELTAE
jgi:hypothetical protein